ncbi:MAG: hypothetical protein DRI56_12025 [Chloroflexota bacterium]|nr:MAG: hypothetical protein DRI56_12025 [Chloroflexota bacterium]
MEAKKEWISTKEAAERLSVTTARVRQMVAEKQVTAQKVGGKYRGQWLIKASDIEKRLSKLSKKGVHAMRVKGRMTPNPVVVSPNTSYNEALHLMRNNGIKHLPVLNKKDELVGIVAHADMLEAEPSPVTTLSVYEMASLLEKVTISKIMTSPVYAVEEDCSITNAAKFMIEKEIGCLPVIRNGELVGIITDTDVVKTFVEITGGEQSGTHVELKTPDRKGEIARVCTAFANANSYIVSIAITYSDNSDYAYVDIKERGAIADALQAEIAKLDDIEIVEMRPVNSDELLSF